MVRFKNGTLDGHAMRVVAYEDQHGDKRFDIEPIPAYRDKAMTLDSLERYGAGLKADVEWGGLLHMYEGRFTNKILKAFIEGSDEESEIKCDGFRMCDVPEE